MNTKRWTRCICATSAMLVAQFALATVERSIEVAQPIVSEEAICINNMTYITYQYGTWGNAVDYTSHENYVVVGDHEKPANGNAGSLAGIKVETDPFYFQEQALYGDTVRVVVNLSTMDVSKLDFEPKDVVEATMECVFINATRSMQGWDGRASASVPARHLRVDVQGSAEFAHLSRTYRFKNLLKRKLERACYGAD